MRLELGAEPGIFISIGYYYSSKVSHIMAQRYLGDRGDRKIRQELGGEPGSSISIGYLCIVAVAC